MELLSPIALHHSTNLLAAVGVVWSDSRRRHKPPKGKVSRLSTSLGPVSQNLFSMTNDKKKVTNLLITNQKQGLQ